MRVLVLLFAMLLCSPVLAEPGELFEQANQAAEAGELEKALELYDKSLSEQSPPNPNTLWNAGVCAFKLKDGERAASYWTKLKAADPHDWRVRSKLVQAYHMTENEEAAQKERDELFAFRKENPELVDGPVYWREQFGAAGRELMVFEAFELTPPRALKYIFVVLTEEGAEDFRISLGTYDSTNAIHHELGDMPEDVRLYHLDGYYDGGSHHKTFSFYEGEPEYSKIRETVIAILEGKKKEVSSSTRPKE